MAEAILTNGAAKTQHGFIFHKNKGATTKGEHAVHCHYFKHRLTSRFGLSLKV